MSRTVQNIRVCCLACLLTLAGVATSAAVGLAADLATVAVFSSNDGAPYEELGASFRAALSKSYPGTKFTYALFSQDEGGGREGLQNTRRQKPALILALGTRAVTLAVREFPDTPVVASMVINSDDFAGAAKATGIILRISPRTHLRWLRRFLPDLRRVAVIYNSGENRPWVSEAEHLATTYGLEIVPIAVDSPQELPRALKELNRKGEVLLGIPDTTVYSVKTAKMVLLSSFRSKIPFVGLSRSWVKAGGIYGLEWDYIALGRECAETAGKILGGAAVGEIKARAPDEHLLYSINLKTAKHMNLDIDPALLAGAAMVFE